MAKVVIFDIDGTLIDSVDLHAHAWQDALRHFGFDLPFDRIRSQIGKGGDQLLPFLIPEDVAERRGEEIQKYRTDLFKRVYISRVRPFHAVRELFERIKADGKRIALASSAKADELQIYKKIADIIDLVDAETCSDDAERSKPHPDIFHAVIDRLDGESPREMVAIGDTPYDAEAATKAGLRVVGVLCGGFPESDLRAAGCMDIYRDPADLLARYEESPIVKD